MGLEYSEYTNGRYRMRTFPYDCGRDNCEPCITGTARAFFNGTEEHEFWILTAILDEEQELEIVEKFDKETRVSELFSKIAIVAGVEWKEIENYAIAVVMNLRDTMELFDRLKLGEDIEKLTHDQLLQVRRNSRDSAENLVMKIKLMSLL